MTDGDKAVDALVASFKGSLTIRRTSGTLVLTTSPANGGAMSTITQPCTDLTLDGLIVVGCPALKLMLANKGQLG